ncbi:phosphotransferase [Amycolatopsis sp. NPDC003731]
MDTRGPRAAPAPGGRRLSGRAPGAGHRRRGPRGAHLPGGRIGPARLGQGGRRRRPDGVRPATTTPWPASGLTWFTGTGEVVCHGDFGPWNVVWRGGQPVGILDWDYARPAPRLHDVAYALEYVAPFRDDAD